MGGNARRRAAKKAAAKIARRLSSIPATERATGHGQTGSLAYVGTYLTLEEYLGRSIEIRSQRYSATTYIPNLLRQHEREILLAELGFLNHCLRVPGLERVLISEYRMRLTPDARARLDKLMNSPDEGRVFLGRQAILRAMRLVLLQGIDSPSEKPQHIAIDAAIRLVHAIANDLGSDIAGRPGPELWPGLSGALGMELIQNYAFNAQEDILSRLTRYDALWRNYGKAVHRTPVRASPDELFTEATGVDRRDLFAVAFALWAAANNWKPGLNYRFRPRDEIGLSPEIVEKCLSLFSVDIPTMTKALRDSSGDWEMLPFEEHPVIELGDGSVLLLDQTYLLDRVTSGLYWYVLGHEERRDEGKKDAERWSTAYAAMVESYAEDRIRAMAPTVANFFTEEQMQAAYRGKLADAVLDMGEFLFFEVQKAPISLASRQLGEVEKFKQATDHIVLEKVAQLESAALQVLNNETPLTGKTDRADKRGRPLIVSGGDSPVNPITTEYISHMARERGLLVDTRFSELCVIDLGELETLEAVSERAARPAADVLREWKSGPGHRFSLRTYFFERRTGDPDQYRPVWMIAASDSLFDDVKHRLRLRSDEDA